MAYYISEDYCIACGTCIDECPVEAIKEGDIYSIDPDLCIECGACADACPDGAISESPVNDEFVKEEIGHVRKDF